ncbi:LPXTG cell wall anchor domain-containing protein [Nocardioides caeni]
MLASLLVPSLLLASPSRADDLNYSPTVPTSCTVDAPRIKVGERPRIEIEVAANTTTLLTGSVDLAIATRAGAGRALAGVVWTRTVRYEGEPRTVLGPRLPRGSYLVTMAFTPDDSAFVGCRNAGVFNVGGGETGGEEDPVPGNLPDTGGPSVLFLLVGGALCASGAGVLGWGRRRGDARDGG